MDSFELNKIIGAILGTLLFVMGVGFLAEGVYAPLEDRGPGYALPEPEPTQVADAGGATAPAEVPVAVRLASANAADGKAAARKCTSCHNFDKGAGNKQGPELYGVVGRIMGSHEGFAYSEAMEAHKATGQVWTYDELDQFLTSPKGYIPGTKMGFAGDKDPQDRANILAFLQTLSDNPVPFPAPDTAPAGDATAPAAEAAPVEGAAPGTPAAGTAPAQPAAQ